MITARPRLSLTIAMLMSLCPVFGLPGQPLPDSPAAKEARGSVRILFDSRGGFKAYHQDAADGSYHPLLNPAVDAPVGLEIYRGTNQLALKPQEGNPVAQDDDPGYRGPSFSADDIQVQLWGLDLSVVSPDWSLVRFELTNGGNTITTLSIRLVFDTWLGESGREPLLLQNLTDAKATVLSDETQIKLDDQTRLAISRRPDGQESLSILLPSKSWPHLIPKRAVVANVRRLQNSGSTFDVEEHRAFNLLPFSINDSALALFYDSEVILPNQKVAIDVLVSAKSSVDPDTLSRLMAGVAAIPFSKTKSPAPSALTSPATTGAKQDELLARINRMLANLNEMLGSENYKQIEVERLVQAIDEAQKQFQSTH